MLSQSAADAFAVACDDDARLCGGAYLPSPMALVIGTIPLGVRRVVEDPQVVQDPSRLRRMVHLEEDLIWHVPLRVGRPLWISAKLAQSKHSRAGETLKIATHVVDATGFEVATTLSTVFIREPSDARPGLDSVVQDPHWQAPAGSLAWQVGAHQPERYARASGETNPIHLDDAIARQAGLSGRILHGLCTMAFAARSVVDGPLNGDCARLRRLQARFSRPVYPSETLWAQSEPTQGGVALRVIRRGGAPVLSRGLAEFRCPS